MQKKARQFPLSDVLSVITGRGISDRGTDGLRDILKFMTDEPLSPYQVGRAIRECRYYLQKQYPELDSSEMHEEIAELEESLDSSDTPEESKDIVQKWIAKQVEKYGEMLDVKPIPADAPRVDDTIVGYW